jgi:hypothetical protein
MATTYIHYDRSRIVGAAMARALAKHGARVCISRSFTPGLTTGTMTTSLESHRRLLKHSRRVSGR